MFIQILIAIGIILGTLLIMEGVAWVAHRFIMHGWLWRWHQDHHDPDLKEGRFFEKNDLFFVVFAIPSMICFMTFWLPGLFLLLWVAIGVTLYGVIYFLVHDVYIHRRFPWFAHLDNPWSRAILRAHGAHHARRTKEGCESFGLLLVHPKYFRSRRKS